MTVTSVNELHAGRTANNDGLVRTYTRSFLVKTDSKSDGAYTAGSAAGLPLIGSTHPEDLTAWCRSLSVAPFNGENAPMAWTVTANYSSEWQLAENPLFEPAKITWSFEQFQTVAVQDKDGYAIVNSAGDLFDPPIMKDDSRPIVSVTKNLAVVPTWLLNYQDAVNSGPFTLDGLTISTGCAKMNAISVGAKATQNGYTYRPVTMDIHLQRDTWNFKVLDVGYRKIVNTTEREMITSDGDGTDPPMPVLLNGSGGVVSDPDTTGGVFLTYNVYATADFTVLPLT